MGAKALASLYILLKRQMGWDITNEGKLIHVLAMSLIYYLYNHQPELIKYRRFFTMVLGEE